MTWIWLHNDYCYHSYDSRCWLADRTRSHTRIYGERQQRYIQRQRQWQRRSYQRSSRKRPTHRPTDLWVTNSDRRLA